SPRHFRVEELVKLVDSTPCNNRGRDGGRGTTTAFQSRRAPRGWRAPRVVGVRRGDVTSWGEPDSDLSFLFSPGVVMRHGARTLNVLRAGPKQGMKRSDSRRTLVIRREARAVSPRGHRRRPPRRPSVLRDFQDCPARLQRRTVSIAEGAEGLV